MKKIGKKEIVLLVLAILVFLSALGYFCYKEIPELIKPKVYYRTYTKEKGWTKWSKNGETSGNGNDITAIQIKLKSFEKGSIKYNVSYDGINYDDNVSEDNNDSGNKEKVIKAFKVMLNKDISKKYYANYRSSTKKTKWDSFTSESKSSYPWPITSNYKTIKYIQIRIDERR